MSGLGATRSVRSLIPAAVAVVSLAAVLIGGSALTPQQATYRQSPVPTVGRTSTVCPSAPATGATGTLAVAAVSQAPGREGRLTGAPVGGGSEAVELAQQGRGVGVTTPREPVVLTGEGVMATAAGGVSFSRATNGELSGLMAATCGVPGTQHWFPGVGADGDYRTELVLTNPDDGQAEVDLRFYGRLGMVVAPGSPALQIDGRSSRTVVLSSLINADMVTPGDPLTVSVRASEGRVSAVALNRASAELSPTGADWQPSSVAPTRSLVLPGIPEGGGTRRLVVTNPGSSRATVSVQVLGLEGGYAPAGAEQLQVAPESSASVDVAAGLAGQPGSLQLTSDRSVTAALVSSSSRTDAQPDIAVQPAATALARTGVLALARVDGADSELTLSNASDTEAQVSLEVISFEGVTLRTDDVLLVGHATATRRLTSPAPAFLVVRSPADSQVYGSVTFTQTGGTVAGLASAQVVSPDLASRAPQTRYDPAVGSS